MELTHASISPNSAIHGHSAIAWVVHSTGMTSARDLSRQRRVLEEKMQRIRQEFAEGDKDSNLALVPIRCSKLMSSAASREHTLHAHAD